MLFVCFPSFIPSSSYHLQSTSLSSICLPDSISSSPLISSPHVCDRMAQAYSALPDERRWDVTRVAQCLWLAGSVKQRWECRWNMFSSCLFALCVHMFGLWMSGCPSFSKEIFPGSCRLRNVNDAKLPEGQRLSSFNLCSKLIRVWKIREKLFCRDSA